MAGFLLSLRPFCTARWAKRTQRTAYVMCAINDGSSQSLVIRLILDSRKRWGGKPELEKARCGPAGSERHVSSQPGRRWVHRVIQGL